MMTSNGSVQDEGESRKPHSSSCCFPALQGGPAEEQNVTKRQIFLLLLLLSLFISISIIATLEIFNAIYYKEGLWIRLGFISAEYNGGKWCESRNPDRTRFIIEPSNSRSDYFYVAFGSFLICIGTLDQLLKQSNDVRDDQILNRNSTVSGATSTRLGHVLLVVNNEEKEDNNKDTYDDPESQQQQEVRIATKNPILYYPHISIIHGIFNILHGLGSFFYHACECNQWFAGKADVAGMVAVASFGAFYTPLHIYSIITEQSNNENNNNNKLVGIILSMLPPLGQVMTWMLVFYQIIEDPDLGLTIFISIQLSTLVLTLGYVYCYINKKQGPNDPHHKFNLWLPFLSLLFFLLGFGAWQLDKAGKWCLTGPNKALTWFQAHAVWHVMTCVSMLYLYLFYRTESIIFSN